MGNREYSIALLFKALADTTRLRLINLIGEDEVCVCFFVEVLKINQPKISRHLAYLRRAGVVSARRDGKWMHYRLIEPPDPHAANDLSRSPRRPGGRISDEKRSRATAENLLRAAVAGSTSESPAARQPGGLSKY